MTAHVPSTVDKMATVALYTIDGDEHDDHVSMRFLL